MSVTRLFALFALLILSIPAAADERAELLEMKNTIENLVDALVKRGVLSADDAGELKTEAAAKARADAATETEVEPATAVAEAPAQPGGKVVRVPYVPEFVKDEIREQVRAQLRHDVTEDVVERAREERWGVKDALPEWVTAIDWSGDLRLRYQGDYMGSGNIANSVADFNAINDAGGIARAGPDVFRNITEDRHRLRVRARLGLGITVADRVSAGVRLITGSLDNPISLNETLGRNGDPIEFNVDRLFLSWDEKDREGLTRWHLTGGRIANPYFQPSDIVWDNDLAFEGVAASIRAPLAFLDPMAGPASPHRHVFLTFGAYPLDESESAVDDGSSNDKWLWGAQAGLNFAFTPNHAMSLAVAYHDYINVVGRPNAFNSVLNDWTAPASLVKGNSLFDIRNDLDVTTELFALAADYTLLNVSGQYRYSGFDPVNVWVTGDVVKNIGYDESDVQRRTGVRIPERSFGYHVGLQVGTACEVAQSLSHCVDEFGEWTLFAYYRYLQRDAVLDAFTDSNFHLGGTDTKGYVLGFDYGITRHTWLRLRFMSSDEIDGAPEGIDTLQVDMNARF